jgi:hypothetical protein
MQAGRTLDAVLAGDDRALTAYAARIEEIHRHYCHNLAAAYALETRWPDHPFWRRRLRDASASREIAARRSPLTAS